MNLQNENENENDNTFKNTLNNINDELNLQLQNPVISGTLNILLILYAGLVAPELPDFMRNFFNSTIGKVIIITLIGFTANKNINISLLIAIGFIITLNFIQTEEFANKIADN